jgi:hypothetical protein
MRSVISCRNAPRWRVVSSAHSTTAAKAVFADSPASSRLRGPSVGSSLRRRSVWASRDQSTSAISGPANSCIARRRSAVPALSGVTWRSASELDI